MAFKDYFIKFQELEINKDYVLRQVTPENDAGVCFSIIYCSNRRVIFVSYKNNGTKTQ